MMEPIEKKSIFIKPSLQHRMQSSHQPEKKKQKISIKWDEVTIAEHDKERGSRQKIDEAPTPFRYGSESDQSEAESGSSDGEHLTRRRKVSAGSFDQANPDPDTVTNTANNSQAASHLAHKYAQHSVLFQWEAVHAKLTYEKHLQEQQQLLLLQQQQQQQLSSADAQATMMVCDDGPEIPPPPPPMQAYPFPSLTAISYDDNTVGDEGDGHDDDDDHLGFDPPTTDFGELVSSPTAHGSTLLVPPPPPLPPAHGGKPVRPALKSSSLMLATGASPTKLSMKRSSSQELQLQLQQQQQQHHLQQLQLGPKPHKHVHIRTQLPTTVHLDTSSPDTPTVGVAFPSSSSSSTAAAVVGMIPSSGLLNATTPTYASVVSTGGNNAYFRYSNPEGYHTTQHSALFAGINASMGGGHDRDLLGDDDDDDDDGDVDSEKKSSTTTTTLHRRISEEMQPAPSHDAQDPPGEDGLAAAGSGDKQQFRNKRAGHYNEYKVLMAMRAKMMAEDDDDDEDDD